MRLTILAPALFLVACGDNLGTPDGGAGPRDAAGGAARAVIVAGDFQTTGVLSTLDLPERALTQNAVAGVAGADPVIRHLDDGHLYIVNRAGGNNVTIITRDTLTLVDQIATGAGSNPQDVAVRGDKLVVAALGIGSLLVFDRANGNARSEISLASLDPADGNPDCVSVYIVDATAYVACGLLDATFTPRGPGVVAIVDVTAGTLTGTIELPAANPFSLFARTPPASAWGGDLVIGTVPSFNDFSTGCLARVAIGATPTAACAFSNQELGGYANRLDPSPEGTLLWLAVDGFTATFEGFGSLQAIDLVTGALWPAAVSPPEQVIVDLAVCPGGVVVVTDNAAAAKGIRVYDNAQEVTTAPMPFGLPPAYGGNVVCYRR